MGSGLPGDLEATPAGRPRLVPTRLGRMAASISGEGPVAVLWHSMFVDRYSWDGVLERLGMTRTLVVVDGPGCGASDRLTRRSSISESAQAAAELVHGLGISTPVDWVGNAWGGHVGMELAVTRPTLVRTLVAVSSPTEPASIEHRRRARRMVPVLRAIGPVAPVRRAILNSQLTAAGQAELAMTIAVTLALARSSRRSLARGVQSFIINRRDVTAQLGQIGAPTLFVTGDDNSDWSPEAMFAAAAMVPDARTAVIPRARTLLPVEQPEALAAVVEDFWRATDGLRL